MIDYVCLSINISIILFTAVRHKGEHQIFFSIYVLEGGVHICKLAYGDLTWENSSNPESLALWYIMIMGHYTPSPYIT